MIDLNLFINVFSDEETVPSRFNPNLSDIPDTLVISRLREICISNGLQYNWSYKASGRYNSNGIAHFTGELTIVERDPAGNVIDSVTRTGSAEAETAAMGISGMSTVAFKNAALRGFGMAEFLYQETAASQPVAGGFAPVQQHPPQQFAPQPQYAPAPPNVSATVPPAPQPRTYGNRPFTPRGQAGGGGQRRNNAPWDGSKLITSENSPYFNQPYSAVRIEDLQKWASGNNPNKNAVAELQRRVGEINPTPPNAFAGQGGYGQNNGY